MKKKRILDNRGFALMEVMVIVVIIGFISTGLFSIIIFGFNNYSECKERADLHQNSRLIKSTIMYDLRYAESLKIIIPGEEEVNIPENYTGDYKELELVAEDEFSYYLKFNGRKITDNILKDMNIISIQTGKPASLKLELEFITGEKIHINTVLNNI